MKIPAHHRLLFLALGSWAALAAGCQSPDGPSFTVRASSRMPLSPQPLDGLTAEVMVDDIFATASIHPGPFEIQIEIPGDYGERELRVELTILGRLPGDENPRPVLRASTFVYLTAEAPATQLEFGSTMFTPVNDDGTPLDDWTQLFYRCPFGVNCALLQVTAGREHTCAIRSDRRIECWGSNARGQLGIAGGDLWRSDPTDLDFEGPQEWRQVSAGHEHTCGITRSGELYCWGDNRFHQMGQGQGQDTIPTPSHVAHPSNRPWELVSAGGAHTCAIDAVGDLYCWGRGQESQLGDFFSDVEPEPREVVRPSGQPWTFVTAGARHTCAIDTRRALYCWGANDSYQSDPQGDTTPTQGLREITAVSQPWAVSAGGQHTCAQDTLGSVRCWGANDAGQLNGDVAGSSATIADIMTTDRALSLDAGDRHTCMATRERVSCWGDASAGRVGLGPDQDRGLLFDVLNVHGAGQPAFEVAAGGRHTCIRVGDGLRCMGSNDKGQLGRGDSGAMSTPASVTLSNPTAIAAGRRHSCAIADGLVWCWGANATGAVTGAPGRDRFAPVQVAGGSATKVAVGGAHTCAVVGDDLLCWGDNTDGQLGQGDQSPVIALQTVPFPGGVTRWVDVALGERHSCATAETSGGQYEVYCWGDNRQCQTGSTPCQVWSAVPVRVEALGSFSPQPVISAGAWHTCALITTGPNTQMWCWGRFNPVDDPTGPAQEPSRHTDWTAVAAGDGFTCGVRGDGVNSWVECGGVNDSGQVGAGPHEGNPYPPWVEVASLPGVAAVQLTAGARHACFATVPGGGTDAACWGENRHGQLGTGLSDDFRPDYQILLDQWHTLAAGDAHTCGIVQESSEDRLYCWGADGHGQLGLGIAASYDWSPQPTN